MGGGDADVMASKAADKNLSFEDALAELESIVSGIEEGKIGLQESITQYERGMQLVQRCRSILSDAEAKIQKLQLADDGTLTAAPLESPDDDG